MISQQRLHIDFVNDICVGAKNVDKNFFFLFNSIVTKIWRIYFKANSNCMRYNHICLDLFSSFQPKLCDQCSIFILFKLVLLMLLQQSLIADHWLQIVSALSVSICRLAQTSLVYTFFSFHIWSCVASFWRTHLSNLLCFVWICASTLRDKRKWSILRFETSRPCQQNRFDFQFCRI